MNATKALLGIGAASVVLVAYLVGWLDWLENRTLDQRFRWNWTNSTPLSDEIVGIDIDDRSIDLVGRWPWPRDVQAALISVPAEVGAKAILVDINWQEPEPPRVRFRDDADLMGDPLAQTNDDGEALSSPPVILPDHELRAAIQGAGIVFPAYHNVEIRGELRHLERSDDFEIAVDAVLRGDEAGARTVLAGYADLTLAGELTPLDRARLTAFLFRNPAIVDPAVAAGALGTDSTYTDNAFPRCQQAALRRHAREWIAADAGRKSTAPAALLAVLYAELTGRAAEEVDEEPVKETLREALRFELSYEAQRRPAILAPDFARRIAARVAGVTPVDYLHAAAAAGCGFVNFAPDADGVMRREALFERHRDQVLSQLAFTVGCAALGLNAERLRAEPGRLYLHPDGASAPIAIQLDERGRVLVPWMSAEREREFTRRCVPAARLWQVDDRRRMIDKNTRNALGRMRVICRMPEFAAFADVADTIDGIADLRLKALAARMRGDLDSSRMLVGMLPRYEARVFARESDLQRRLSALALETPPFPAIAAWRHLQRLEEARWRLDVVEQCRRANTSLQKEVDALLTELRERIAGKLCLIGYTATALADMTPTPTSSRTPGVRAHANLLNGMMTNRYVSWLTPAQNGAIAAMLSVVVSAAGVWMRPRHSLALLGAVLASLVVAAWAVFYFRAWWIAITPAAGAAIASYTAIGVYQYLFVDRERRELVKALSQYTSATLARQMAEKPELCRRAETREVTAMFTDLAGFTTISERIGAERTQRVLNISLGCFSEVMLAHEAMINKFIGDGVFVFWNPVIHPQGDHARRAVETAVDLQFALHQLIERQRLGGGDEIFAELVLRVGVATGNAVVGPCGSEQKYDYTCIGDSVNVAARLESANKFFGTCVLVSGGTREKAGAGFVYRPLGSVQVKGKRTGVPVFELLGREGDVSAEAIRYASRFGAAIEAFHRRDWDAARQAFDACRKERPTDIAADAFLRATESLRNRPPGEEWNGAIELMEK